MHAPKRKRSRNGERENGKGSKCFTYEYSVTPNDVKLQVCMEEFIALHGIGKTRLKRIIKPTTTAPLVDMRGHHDYHPTLPLEIKDKIKQHISSFPKRESHYSRSEIKHREYLDERLNVKRMWLLYLHQNEPEQRLLYTTDKKSMKPVVKYKYYLNVFNKEFNLSFGQPRSDTCPICDKFHIDIEATTDETRKNTLINQRNIHQQKADSAYHMLNLYCQKAQAHSSLEVYTFDFQQNLPAPSISAGDMFYSRMFWTYNFGIHDCKTGDVLMHLWCEAEAGRGSSEVASCLRQTLLTRRERYRGKNLILFSDGCAGQNKNKTMVYFLLGLVKEGIYASIQHYFLYRGHTFLPNDRDFSHIEERKHLEKVDRPENWERIVKDSRLSKPFQVEFFDHNSSYDYKTLADKTIKSTLQDSEGEQLKFKEVMWFSYGASLEMNETMDEENLKEHADVGTLTILWNLGRRLIF
ncbi:hypothetical protein RRG08_066797 [Elysia crispata]|uniref:DUF7869 domain-containing protein n=1 Tax=Elysia crispata TaxID=231223 RepID=A0AAE0XPL2_9GAST|nr:hypothetical protein RRG08_066797 [Elysia crispata]